MPTTVCAAHARRGAAQPRVAEHVDGLLEERRLAERQVLAVGARRQREHGRVVRERRRRDERFEPRARRRRRRDAPEPAHA